ncbi:MAG: aminotransferase class IV [Saprospiraceae bacterium]
MSNYFCVNGKIVLAKNAKLQVTDLGLLRGYGIFDFLKIENGIPLFIEDHMVRFQRSAKEMGLKVDYSVEELKKFVMKLIVKNEFRKGGMKIILTGGYSTDGYLPAKESNLIILLTHFKMPSKKVFAKGVKLMLHEHFRQTATIKTTNYIEPIRLANDLKKAKAIDVLYHWDGKISESSRSNFFIVKKDKTIVTSSSHVLKGITRKRVMNLANEDYTVIEKDITFQDLKNATEAFLSSTTKGTLPVVQIDDIKIGNGKPGKVSPHLNELLKKQVEKYKNNFKK